MAYQPQQPPPQYQPQPQYYQQGQPAPQYQQQPGYYPQAAQQQSSNVVIVQQPGHQHQVG